MGSMALHTTAHPDYLLLHVLRFYHLGQGSPS